MTKSLKFFILLSILTIFTLVLLFNAKSIIISQAEPYLSELLKQSVKVSSLTLYPLSAKVFIDKESNNLAAELTRVFPLSFYLKYDGDIDAFSTFHPLVGKTQIEANLLYSTNLFIDANTTLYNSNTDVKVDNTNSTWNVYVDAKHLSVDSLKRSNAYDFNISGEIDTELSLLVDEENLTSHFSFVHEKLKSKDSNIAFNTEDGNFKIDTNLEFLASEEALITSEGSFKDGNLSAKLHAKLDALDIDLKNISYISKNKSFSTHYFIDVEDFKRFDETYKIPLQGSFIAKGEINAVDKRLELFLQTSSLGGETRLDYSGEKVFLKAKALHLSKILKLLKQKPLARGYVYTTASLDINNSNSNFDVYLPKLTVGDISLQEPLSIKGYLSYLEKIKLALHTSYFKSDIKLQLSPERLSLSAKGVDLEELLEVAKQEKYASAKMDLNIAGTFDKLNFQLQTDNLVTDKNLTTIDKEFKVKVGGAYNVKEASVNSSYSIQTSLKDENITVNGDVKYKKILIATAKSSNFDSHTLLKIKDKQFQLNSTNLNLSKLLHTFEQKPYAKGFIDLNAKGELDNVDMKIESNKVTLNKKHTSIDENLSLDMDINYTPRLISIKPHIKSSQLELNGGVSYYDPKTSQLRSAHKILLFYKKQKIPIKLNADSLIKAPYNLKARITHDRDIIDIERLSYANNQIKSDFIVDIKELNFYKALTQKELYGPLKLIGEYNDALVVTSSSLGGESRLKIKKENLSFTLKDIQLPKISHFNGKSNRFSSGVLNGNIHYNLNNESGTTDIKITNAQMHGVDIDKELSAVTNTLGLNIFGLGRGVLNRLKSNKEGTQIQHLQFDTSLKNKTLKLQDVALSTNKFLIAAKGDLQASGEINALNIYLIDVNGCTIIDQKLRGNIQKPEIESISTAVEVVSSIPSSVLGTGKKLINFTTKTLDKTASLAINATQISDGNVSLTSEIVSKGTSIIPLRCPVVYKGKVKHPKTKR